MAVGLLKVFPGEAVPVDGTVVLVLRFPKVPLLGGGAASMRLREEKGHISTCRRNVGETQSHNMTKHKAERIALCSFPLCVAHFLLRRSS